MATPRDLVRQFVRSLGLSPLEQLALEVSEKALGKVLEGRARRLDRAAVAGQGPPPPWLPPEADGTPVHPGVVVELNEDGSEKR